MKEKLQSKCLNRKNCHPLKKMLYFETFSTRNDGNDEISYPCSTRVTYRHITIANYRTALTIM